MQSQLIEILGTEGLNTEAQHRQLFSQDVFREGEVAEYIARPSSVEQLQAVVKLAAENGYALVPRGGAMSYTDGIVPAAERTVVIDMGAR